MFRLSSSLIRSGTFLRRFSNNHYRDNLLSRTREIFEVGEAVESLRSIGPGSVIGIDVEGHHQIRLLQLRDEHKNLLIYRIAANPKLLATLAPVLENSEVIKVIHQGYKDIFSLYRAGIHFWGLFDTSLAHKVFLYQSKGESLFGKNTISYAGLCQYHGYEVLSPLANAERIAHLRDSDSGTPLSEEYLMYCAQDADHLLDLHLVISSLLDPDFRRLERELSEKEILRVLDPQMSPQLSERNRSLDKNNLFLRNLPPKVVNPFYVHEILDKVSGRKRMHFSHTYGTLHILFEKRSWAIQSLFMMQKASQDQDSLLHGTEASLLVPLKPLDKDKSILLFDEAYLPPLVDILIKMEEDGFPIAIDFGASPSSEEAPQLFLDVLICNEPMFRIELTPGAISSLKTLFESNSVHKVVFNMAVSEYGQGIKLLKAHGIEPKGMRDLMTTYKLYLYSSFQMNPFSLNFISRKEFLRILGLENVSNRLESNLMAYVHFSKGLLPPRIHEFVGALSKLETDIVSSEDPEDSGPRIVKGRLKNRLIHESLAIHSSADRGGDIVQSLSKAFSPLCSPEVRLLSENLALVEFPTPQQASESAALLPPSYFILPWKKTSFHPKDSIPKVSIPTVLQHLRPHSQALRSLLESAMKDDEDHLQENLSTDVFI